MQKRQQKQQTQISNQQKIYNRHFYLRKANHEQLQEQYQSQLKILANMPKITPSSYAILANKIQVSLSQILNPYKQQIKFNQFQSILQQYIKTTVNELELQTLQCQLWLLLNEYELNQTVQTKRVFMVLRILLDPYNLTAQEIKSNIKKIPTFQKIDLKRQQFIKQHPDVEDQTLKINKIISLWRKYKITTYNSQKLQIASKIDDSTTFQPEINIKSKQLAKKQWEKYVAKHQARLLFKNQEQNQLFQYMPQKQNKPITPKTNKNISIHELLYERKLQKDQLIKTQDTSKDEQMPKSSRQAKPQQIKQIVQKLYYTKPKNEQPSFRQVQEQKELKLCTFKPKINKSNSARSISPIVKSYDSNIQRMKIARDQKIKKNQIYQNLGRVKNLHHMKQPSFIERDTPKLILDIKIASDRVERVLLKGDEDPKIFAKKFITKHNLQSSMQSVLQELIQQNLANL